MLFEALKGVPWLVEASGTVKDRQKPKLYC